MAVQQFSQEQPTANVNTEAAGSAAFRRLGHELQAVSNAIHAASADKPDHVILARMSERMADMVEIALQRNFVAASVEHRRGFAKDLAELMCDSIDGLGMEEAWWNKGRTEPCQVANQASAGQNETAHRSAPSAEMVEIALSILEEHLD